jgi:hypothetical protein
MTKKKCIGDHSVHICELANNTKHDEILKLVKEPHYMCFKCGRVAHAEKNLCNPLAFDKIPFAIAH